MKRIFVTGMGVVSALGDRVETNLAGLRSNRSGISNLELFSSAYAFELPFAEVKISNKEFSERNLAFEPGLTRTSLLALTAFKEAVENSGLTQSELTSSKTALIGANTVGGMCLTHELYTDANSKDKGSPYLSSYDSGSVCLYLQKRFEMLGPVNTINTACSSSANAISYGARLIKNGWATKAIVGGVDSLSKFTINGFNALHILSSEPCRPFDAHRKGLNLGEGAAFLVLEGAEVLGKKPVYAELTGYCNANDAHHPSSLSEEGNGPYLAMKGALALADLNPASIGFINTHGTGTENNDAVEAKAMLKVFGDPPAFASTKSNVGHTLGASGAIEAVYSIFNLMEQEIYASLNFTEAMAGIGLQPVLSFQKIKLNHVMSNSFGFGGNCSSLIFSKA